MSDKIFVGSGKTGKYGTKISICLSDIPKEHITEVKGRKFINLELKERKEADKFGKTHYVIVDTWKPDKPISSGDPKIEQMADYVEDSSELPF